MKWNFVIHFSSRQNSQFGFKMTHTIHHIAKSVQTKFDIFHVGQNSVYYYYIELEFQNKSMNIVCRLGRFHTLISFMSSKGKMMKRSGLESL